MAHSCGKRLMVSSGLFDGVFVAPQMGILRKINTFRKRNQQERFKNSFIESPAGGLLRYLKMLLSFALRR